MSELEHAMSGEAFARKNEQENFEPLPLGNPQVQVYLSMIAFPHDAKPMNKWLEDGDLLSSRFRAYMEDPLHAEEEIDIKDKNALAKLLDAVKNHAPEILH